MNVLIVGDLFAFPHFSGSGATSRVRAYANGLRANGARVKVICVEPTERGTATINTVAKGTFEGIEFEYTYGTTARPPRGWRRRMLKLLKGGRFLFAACTWAREDGGADAMLVYSRTFTWIAAARLACWITGAVFLHEDCERPFTWQRDGVGIRAHRWFYERVTFKAFDASLAISSYLEGYCAARLRCGANVLVVPILVDVSEFVAAGDAAAAGHSAGAVGDYVAYCGFLSHPQSRSVIEAFSGIAADFPEIHLQMIGGSRRPGAEGELRELVRSLDLSDRVEFAGKVPRSELIDRLSSARVLVLPRPKEKAAQAAAEAALPTKVGEYLASGRPVVATATGDLPLYLTDGVDAYLAPEGDLRAFTERLRRALAEPDEATAVGLRGRVTAQERFDPVAHGARILAFIEELQRSRRGCSNTPPRPE